MVDRLDGERLEVLRTWGGGLATDTRAELRAAGKAIMILIEEIDRLHVDARRAREKASTRIIDATNSGPPQEHVEAVSSQSLGTTLRERLGAVIPSTAPHDGRD